MGFWVECLEPAFECNCWEHKLQGRESGCLRDSDAHVFKEVYEGPNLGFRTLQAWF